MYNIEYIKQFKEMCGGISILMLDDEVLITDAYKALASRFFTSIEISNDPREVLDNFEMNKYDIIYTDLNMPYINGVDLIKSIKVIDPKQKFIVISASDESARLLELFALNVSGFIVKPFNVNNFISVSLEQVSIILQLRLMHKKASLLQDELFNVTEEKKEQAEMLIRQSKLAQTGEMISMISHQWRQPLSSITTLLAGLKTRFDLGLYESKENPLEAVSNDFYQVFEKVEASAIFLSQTINDFRNFYRPDKDKSTFNVCDAINSIIQMINIDDAKIIIDMKCLMYEESIVYTFEGELKQVFMSIINNAFDALKEKNVQSPKVTVHINTHEKNVCVSIADNAGGIPENILESVFLPYFSTKSEKNGTGLGLHMAKTIIEQHVNGSILARNSAEFQGAEFIITIPKTENKG